MIKLISIYNIGTCINIIHTNEYIICKLYIFTIQSFNICILSYQLTFVYNIHYEIIIFLNKKLKL